MRLRRPAGKGLQPSHRVRGPKAAATGRRDPLRLGAFYPEGRAALPAARMQAWVQSCPAPALVLRGLQGIHARAHDVRPVCTQPEGSGRRDERPVGSIRAAEGTLFGTPPVVHHHYLCHHRYSFIHVFIHSLHPHPCRPPTLTASHPKAGAALLAPWWRCQPDCLPSHACNCSALRMPRRQTGAVLA